MKTKHQVLAQLEQHRGQHISGETLAARLFISRNAVWKAIRELKKDGHHIDAVTKKGYCLCLDNDILSAQGIQPFLAHQDLPIFVHESLESTNKTAKELALDGASHGTLVVAGAQTAGKGRYGRAFFSAHGIYMSLILRPSQLWLSTPTLVTAYAAIAVCEMIEALLPALTPTIKWVNDILIDGKKVCGILTEGVADLESGQIGWIVVGIGINVNTPEFPNELQAIADSIHTDIPRNRIVADITNRLLKLETPQTFSEQDLLAQYKQRMPLLGEIITVHAPTEVYDALAVDVDDSGRLVVKKTNGEIVTLLSGEVSVRTTA
ncbi:MAG: biotin--[acetyl-CoA-carboxylase] ligase [Oscillospiraceae bacterium]|nr:biotin--[acetyl-CoA-carboxylase] ligase [Oscillospiraceae bacterium]